MKLRSHLLGLVMASVFPLLVFVTVLIMLLLRQQEELANTGLTSATRVFMAAVDERITSVITGLEILAASEEFDSKNFRDFHRRVSRTVESQEGWWAVSLGRPDGAQIFNTYWPFGKALPSLDDVSPYMLAAKSGQTAVSGYRLAKSSKSEVVSIHVPVQRGNSVQYVLTATIQLRTLTQLVKDQNVPADWTVAILDADGVIIARSRSPESFVGLPATPGISQAIREKEESFFEDVTREGFPTYGAFKRSDVTGWTMVIGLPLDQAHLSRHPFFRITVFGGLSLLFAALLLALILSRRISKPIVALARSADALGRGGQMEQIQSSVSEVDQVADALTAAAIKRKESDDKAQEAIQLRDNFLSVASHELKTPLTALQLQLQLLERKSRTAGSDHLNGPLSQMSNQIRRLTRLIDELLDVSRIAAGRMELHLEELEIGALITEVASHFEGEKERTGSEVQVSVKEPVTGKWDRARLEQVFTNLISNAFKYGSGKPIQICVSREHNQAKIEVKDHGIGIAETDLDRIFQRFERAVSPRNYGGLGLGLWITQRIVELSSGKIKVASRLSEGSTFTVTLPISDESIP